MTVQARLSDEQIAEFFHDEFVDDQVRDFVSMLGTQGGRTVVDVGGGCGFFAGALSNAAGYFTRVIDADQRSIDICRERGGEGTVGDALDPDFAGDEEVVCFNLILHHLVGADEQTTRGLQIKALAAWRQRGVQLFVNEYIYQSFVGNLSGRLIFEITSSRILSAIGRLAARIVPSLRANTFGTGVRFRSHEEWRRLFAEAGYQVADCRTGSGEFVAVPLRGLLIRTIRRDSFVLESN